ncbi:CU044_2847 family protein [Nocardiopsis sediminis]|uniref:CU044_2847 family protein n=1 Tax=Nocardiopsis sediminis TaxID=1778267 RepID=A0ABV8FR17_9ACTN
MAEIIRFTSDEGASVLVEAAGSSPGMQEVSGRDIIRSADEKFEAILGKVRELSRLIGRELGDLAAGPEEITVEMGISVNAEADVFIARAAAESALAVTMTWRREGAPITRKRH